MPKKFYFVILASICAIVLAVVIFQVSKQKESSQLFKKVSQPLNLKAALSLNWVQKSTSSMWQGRSSHEGLVFNNKMWVMGGSTGNFKNDVWYSSGGATWTQATANAAWAPRTSFASLVFNNKMWVMGGVTGTGTLNNDVWYSSDGVTWTQATAHAAWSKRSSFPVVVYNNKMWVFGGYTGLYANDVWYSSDGVTWTQASTAVWSGRSASALIFNNKIWVIGGGNTTCAAYQCNDVWSSTDGTNWTQVTAGAAWSGRTGHQLVDYNNKIWLLGGYSLSNTCSGKYYCHDIWYSADGITWTQVETGHAPWSERIGEVSLVFDSRIWVLGGWDTNSVYKNDVWWSSLTIPTVNFKINNSENDITVPYNSTVTLTWSSTGSEECIASATDSGVGWSGNKALSGSATSNKLVNSVTFTLSCGTPGMHVIPSITVIVSPPNYTFNSVVCDWDWPQIVVIDGVSQPCNWTQIYCNNDRAQQGIGQCCVNAGPYSDCIPIIPTPAADLKVNNSNGPVSITSNTSATLSWTSSGAASCAASGDWSGAKAKSSSGESTGNITSAKTYTLTCINPSGSASDSVTVNTSCVENWSCGNWSTCSNNQQTRTCADASNCGTTANKPATTQTCTAACTENWSCGEWSACSGGQKTRTCTDANSCGTTANKPATTQVCCSESWNCGEWSACTNNQQTRTCTDINYCGTTADKPVTTQSCSSGGEVTGIPEGALIRAINDIDVYIVKYMGTKRFKRLILSPSVFNSYGHLKWSDIKDVARSTVDLFTTSEVVRATEAGDVRVYKLYPQGDTGEKRWIKTEAAFTRMGQDWDAVYTINETDRDSYITGQVEE